MLQHRDAERGPFAAAATLLRFPFPDHSRIEADARVVDEEATVDVADVELTDLSGDDRLHRGLEVQRESEILGEVIERAHWEDAEGCAGRNRHRRHRADGAVAAGRDEHVPA